MAQRKGNSTRIRTKRGKFRPDGVGVLSILDPAVHAACLAFEAHSIRIREGRAKAKAEREARLALRTFSWAKNLGGDCGP